MFQTLKDKLQCPLITKLFFHFRNCHQLSESQLDDLLILCVLISPDELLNKCIFHDDQLCGDYQNEFYDIASVQNRLLITSNILVGGQTKKVKKIMTFKMVFLESNYYTPIRFYADRLQRIARGEAPPPPQPPQQNITYMITYTNPPVPQRSNDGCCTIL